MKKNKPFEQIFDENFAIFCLHNTTLILSIDPFYFIAKFSYKILKMYEDILVFTFTRTLSLTLDILGDQGPGDRVQVALLQQQGGERLQAEGASPGPHPGEDDRLPHLRSALLKQVTTEMFD